MILIKCEKCGSRAPAYKFKKPDIFYSDYLFKYRGVGFGVCQQCKKEGQKNG